MSEMPIRSRLSIDASSELIAQVNLLAAALTVAEKIPVTPREVIFRALTSYALSKDEPHIAMTIANEGKLPHSAFDKLMGND